MALDLDRKIGPLKLKTWGLVGAGTVGLVVFATRRGGALSDDATSEDASDFEGAADVFPGDGSGFYPSDFGGGFGGGGTATEVDLSPIADALVDLSGQVTDLGGQIGGIEELLQPPEEMPPTEPPPEEPPPDTITDPIPSPDPLRLGRFADRLERQATRREKLIARRKEARSPKQRRRLTKKIRASRRVSRQVRARRRRYKRRFQ